MKFISILIIALNFKLDLCSRDFNPESILGHQIGTEFSKHHQVVSYFDKLNQAYPKTSKLIEYGKSNEGRKLQLLFIR